MNSLADEITAVKLEQSEFRHLLKENTDDTKAIKADNTELRKHFDDRFDQLEALIKSGFPDGDPASHRRVHEQHIKEAAEKAEVWLAIKKSVLSSGVWLALLTIVVAVGSYFGIEVKK